LPSAREKHAHRNHEPDRDLRIRAAAGAQKLEPKKKNYCDNNKRFGSTEIWPTAKSTVGRCALRADGKRTQRRVRENQNALRLGEQP
jgi:hypothetical protein